MANRKRDAGREALEKKGWWRSHRWLVLRRLCQFFVLGMFLSGPWFGVWILHGNYSSSLLFDTVPLTDPLHISLSASIKSSGVVTFILVYSPLYKYTLLLYISTTIVSSVTLILFSLTFS